MFAEVLNESSMEEAKAFVKKYFSKNEIKISSSGMLIAQKDIILDMDELSELGVTFEDCPKKKFIIRDNVISTLKGCPSVCKEFDAAGCNLKNLDGGPTKITDGDYVISSNDDLVSLKGGPEEINGNFYALYCKLTTEECIQYLPKKITGSLKLSHNNLNSLKGIHKRVEHLGGCLYIGGNPIKSHILGALLIPGIEKIIIAPRKGEVDKDLDAAAQIMNKFLRENKARDKSGVVECQTRMIEADLDDLAQM